MILRSEHYHRAALERMDQARRLYRHGSSYALAMYAAGVAVECMLRAFKLKKDPTFDERHDLLRLFKASGIPICFGGAPESTPEEKRAFACACRRRCLEGMRPPPDGLGAAVCLQGRAAMENLVKKVTKLLKRAFRPPDQVDLRDEDGILGAVISSRFRGLDSIDRVNLIWDVLDKKLAPQERRRVVTIIAVTPEEEIAHTS